MKVGLYFGTFNPIHVGHLIIANHIADFTTLDKIWLVVSPENPLKRNHNLLSDYHRLALTRIAVEGNRKLAVSNIEFDLPKPSYTIDTLIYLEEKYPEHDFSLIMGEDNLRSLNRWKNFEQIISNYPIYIYPRLLTEEEKKSKKADTSEIELIKKKADIHFCDAPVMKLSASYIRKAIEKNKDVSYLLTAPVYKYVMEMHFYEKKKA